MKRILGWGLLAWGAVGAYNQFTVYQAAAAGNPSAVSMFQSIDPANLFKVPTGSGLFTAALATDLAIAGVGAYLAFA